LNDLITEKPLRLSFKVEVYTSFLSETSVSAFAILPPAVSDARSGRNENAIAMSVSRGLYQSISAKAPIKAALLPTMEKILDKYPCSMACMSFVRAEIYVLEFSLEKADMFFFVISEKTYSLY